MKLHSYFNPHLPCGRWPVRGYFYATNFKFQSTPSLQKVTQGKRNKTAIAKFQSTPSLQKVTATYFACIKRLSISIHTFLAEGDLGYRICFDSLFYFNPHLPCGRWQKSSSTYHLMRSFQSTPSLRKVTFDWFVLPTNFLFQSTPSLRRVT